MYVAARTSLIMSSILAACFLLTATASGFGIVRSYTASMPNYFDALKTDEAGAKCRIVALDREVMWKIEICPGSKGGEFEVLAYSSAREAMMLFSASRIRLTQVVSGRCIFFVGKHSAIWLCADIHKPMLLSVDFADGTGFGSSYLIGSFLLEGPSIKELTLPELLNMAGSGFEQFFGVK